MKEMGVLILTEANNGTGTGAMISPSCTSSTNQSRSDARTAYFDTAIDRNNLHVASEQTVSLVLLESSQRTLPIHTNAPFHSLVRARGVEVIALIFLLLSYWLTLQSSFLLPIITRDGMLRALERSSWQEVRSFHRLCFSSQGSDRHQSWRN